MSAYTMRTSLAALAGMLLFSGGASLIVSRPKPQSKKAESKGAHTGEDRVVLGGVPVYGYHTGLAYARKTNSFKTGHSKKLQDAVATWIVEFDPNNTHVTAEKMEEICATIFAPCTDHGDLDNSTGHLGLPYLVTHLTGAELNRSLAQVQGAVRLVAHDSPTKIFDSHLDYSGHLADDKQTAATWGLNKINKDSAPAAGFGVHAYVLDTGIKTTHSQFTGRAVPQLESLGSARKCECQNTTCARDTHGHGTHCAGTIAGVDYGVAPQARVHAVKVLGDDGYGFTSWSIAAESWILSNGMRPAVVSMSLGGGGNNYAEKYSIDALVADGVAVVVAAGNEQDNACNYNPAWIPNAVTVGSTTSGDALSWFSNFGTCVDILAPGSGVWSAGISSDTALAQKSGTSMACPHVSGAVAILQSLNPAMTPAQIIAELTSEASSGVITGVPSGTPNLLLQVDSISGR